MKNLFFVLKSFFIEIICGLLILVNVFDASAQVSDKLYISDKHIDCLQHGRLLLDFDNLSFFKDNEFNSHFQKGYTLPGFWLQAKVKYFPLSNVKLEAGLHSIWFWGANRYPAYSYTDIPTWRDGMKSHKVHLVPYLRTQIALTDNFSIVLGDIYGGANHRLIEMFYNPELNMTTDPEVGTQALFNSKYLDADLWINWMTFIYNLDTHQEAFTFGVSSKLKANDEQSILHFYFPIQCMALHRGGEIDTFTNKTQTLMNAAVGVGFTWNVGCKVLKLLNTEIDIVGSKYTDGTDYIFESGSGIYWKTQAQLFNFGVKCSLWSCNNYVPILGSVFYSSTSSKSPNLLFDKPKMLHLGVDYMHKLSNDVTFGIFADFYYHFSGMAYSIDTGESNEMLFKNNNNFSFGICMRINPSFLLKQY